MFCLPRLRKRSSSASTFDLNATAAALAEKESVDIRLHTIIYELTDEIKKAMTGLLDPTFKEVFKGRAEVREVFRISKVGIVAGCYVTEGTLSRGNLLRLTRDNIVIHTGRIDTLKRFKDDVTEVKTGFECGVTIAQSFRCEARRHHRSFCQREGRAAAS